MFSFLKLLRSSRLGFRFCVSQHRGAT